MDPPHLWRRTAVVSALQEGEGSVSTELRGLGVRPNWLGQHYEEAIDPGLPIVDPHHHLVDRAATGRYLLPELAADIASGHNVVSTVYLEWLSKYRSKGPVEFHPIGEVEFANHVAITSANDNDGKTRVCAGIVGYADLQLGARVQSILESMISVGDGRFKGIRFASATDPDQATWSSMPQRRPGLLNDARVREGFRRLAPLGLTFDAWAYHPQLGEVLDLAQAFPDTVIVLDHAGGAIGVGRYSEKRKDVFVEWNRLIQELASCPNVYVKLGGFGMRLWGFSFEARDRPPSSVDLAIAWRPYIETCISAFGPRRSMFESNFPVDKVSCSYGVLWNAFKRITTTFSSDEKNALFSGTARAVYRLAES